jgi:nickel superoxide dismutase
MLKNRKIRYLTVLSIAATLLLLVMNAGPVLAHCQIPCGIYGDQMRFDLLAEHITTIEKSMKQIEALSADPAKNANQLIRWVNNKDDHCLEFEEIITYYFLQQRIKPVDPGADGYDDYLEKLRRCHNLLLHTMKSKQTTDLAHIEALRSNLEAFRNSYFTKEELAHAAHHHGSDGSHAH